MTTESTTREPGLTADRFLLGTLAVVSLMITLLAGVNCVAGLVLGGQPDSMLGLAGGAIVAIGVPLSGLGLAAAFRERTTANFFGGMVILNSLLVTVSALAP